MRRAELIDQCIAWKLSNPAHVKLFIGKKEVVIQQELQARNKKPDLPRVYGSERMKPITVGEHIVLESPTGEEQIFPRLGIRHSLFRNES